MLLTADAPVSSDAQASYPAPAPDSYAGALTSGGQERLHESNTPLSEAYGPLLSCVQV